MTHMKAKAKEKGSPDGAGGSNGSSSGDNDGRGHMRGRGKGRGGGRGIGDGTGRDAYYNCGKTGYWSRECRSKQKKEEAHVAQDEESSLLLMEAGVVKAAMISSPTATGDTTACRISGQRDIAAHMRWYRLH
jgi:hypothetical protein